MVSTIKFSQFAVANLANTTNQLVGVSAPTGGQNFQTPLTLSWTTAGRPSTPPNGLLGYNTDLGQYEYWNGSAWVQLASGGSGTVNTGSVNQLAWYMSSGTAVSGLNTANSSVLTTTSGGAPIWSTTLPAALTIPQPIIQGIIDGSAATAGQVGQVMSSITLSGSAVSLSNGVSATIAQLNITAGQWIIWGNIFVNSGGTQNISNYQGWISSSSSHPDNAFVSEINQAGINAPNGGIVVPMQPINVTTTTTYFLKGLAAFGSGTAKGSGSLYALRVR
jgi:hypothetical protein